MISATTKKRTRAIGTRCRSIIEWQHATGTSQTRLRERLAAEQHYAVSAGHLCDVVQGSRRCSLAFALALWRLTGVSVDSIAAWPRLRPARIVRARRPQRAA